MLSDLSDFMLSEKSDKNRTKFAKYLILWWVRQGSNL